MTEVKKNIGLLEIAWDEDIILTKYGKPYLQISKPKRMSSIAKFSGTSKEVTSDFKDELGRGLKEKYENNAWYKYYFGFLWR